MRVTKNDPITIKKRKKILGFILPNLLPINPAIRGQL